MLKKMLLYLRLKWGRLIGDREKFPLENRIFNAFLVFTIITEGIETIINLFNGLQASVWITAFIGSVLAMCYYLSRFKNKVKLAVIFTAIVVNALTAVGYFYNSGLSGSTLLLFVVILFVLMLIVQPKQWLFWYAINLIVVLSLVILEYYQPGAIQLHYEDRKSMFIDIAAAYTIAVTILFICATYMRKMYNLQVALTEEKAVKLQQLHNEKDKLFSIISHDLNAPLASLKQYFDLLNEVELEPSERLIIEKDLVRSVTNTQELLQNLLHWSKGQMKEVMIDLKELNLQQALRSTLNTFQPIAQKKAIELVSTINSSIILTADINMLQLVVRNLLNNAIKFTPPKGKITVSASIKQDRCIVSIADTGVGIPMEKQIKIFSVKMQSTAGTTCETGSGLGLLLVNDYTLMQEGNVWFTSEPGQGTTFCVSLKGRLKDTPPYPIYEDLEIANLSLAT